MRVVIVGGGVIGLSAAYELLRAGVEVTVLDAALVGRSASYGNAGWIVPSMARPLASPGVVRKGIRWMARRDSPLLIRPRFDPSFGMWLWRFWRASRTRYGAGVGALTAFAGDSVARFERYVADGVAPDLLGPGFVLACRTERQLEEEQHSLTLLRTYGYDARERVLHPADLVQHEPALAENLAGGILIPDERHVDPRSLVDALARAVWRDGGEVVEQARVVALRRNGTRWVVVSTRGDLRADRVVVAAGYWSRDVLASVGVRIPLFPQLQPRRRQPAGTLSGGERQMLALARALIGDPEVVLLDEPSAGLSPVYADALFEKISEINGRGVTILMVEQNARRSLAISHRGYVLDVGRNRFAGTGQELLHDPKVIDLYLGGTGRIDAEA